MNRSVLSAFFLLFACVFFIFSCSGSMTNPLRPGASALSVTITDTPTAVVTVLSFEVSVTEATFNPGGVDLLADRGPVHITVALVEKESAFARLATTGP